MGSTELRRYDPTEIVDALGPQPAPVPKPARAPHVGDARPGDTFNDDHTGGELLMAYGFTFVRRDGNGDEHYRRPGKTSGQSATVFADDGHVTIWSETCRAWWPGVLTMRPYDPFGLYGAIEHGGNLGDAARELNRHKVERWMDSIRNAPSMTTAPAASAATTEVSDLLPVPVDWRALFTRTVDYEWLVEDFWPAGRQLHIFAARKTGKSLVMLNIAACLAAGRDPFTGEAQAPVVVIYLDYEMSEEDLLERVEDMGFTPEVLANLRYYLHPALASLDTAEGGAGLMALVERDHAEAVVLDTVSRIVQGEENASDTFRALWRHTGARLKAAGVSLARLDHEGHEAGRSRGSSAKADDVDVVWRLATADNGYTFTRKAARIAWVPERLEITRTLDPLTFRRTTGNWPAGTKHAADRLDQLGAPIDITRERARALLKAADGTAARNDVLAKALKYRRQKGAPT